MTNSPTDLPHRQADCIAREPTDGDSSQSHDDRRTRAKTHIKRHQTTSDDIKRYHMTSIYKSAQQMMTADNKGQPKSSGAFHYCACIGAISHTDGIALPLNDLNPSHAAALRSYINADRMLLLVLHSKLRSTDLSERERKLNKKKNLSLQKIITNELILMDEYQHYLRVGNKKSWVRRRQAGKKHSSAYRTEDKKQSQGKRSISAKGEENTKLLAKRKLAVIIWWLSAQEVLPGHKQNRNRGINRSANLIQKPNKTRA